MQVDAFAASPLTGNPCAIVFDADSLDAVAMQAIAREMNLSETAFVLRSNVADVRARYFTPAEEIPLAGHPTIATAFALAETGRIPLDGDRTRISLELQVGPIAVDICCKDGRVERVVMTQLKPEFLARPGAGPVARMLGLTPADFIAEAEPQVVSTGTPQLMVCVRDLQSLRQLSISHEAMALMRQTAGFFSVHVFCLTRTNPPRTFARHFVPPPDVFEDPFTGSATGGMAAFLWHFGIIGSNRLTAEQGHWMGRPGQAVAEAVGPRQDITAVRVGGSAVTTVRGELLL